jgi:hypothetical protein
MSVKPAAGCWCFPILLLHQPHSCRRCSCQYHSSCTSACNEAAVRDGSPACPGHLYSVIFRSVMVCREIRLFRATFAVVSKLLSGEQWVVLLCVILGPNQDKDNRSFKMSTAAQRSIRATHRIPVVLGILKPRALLLTRILGRQGILHPMALCNQFKPRLYSCAARAGRMY